MNENFMQPFCAVAVRLVRGDVNSNSRDHMKLTGLTSSFCVLPGSPYIKSGKEYSTTLGKLWQRRMYKGRIRCQLGGTSSSQEDEIGPDANMQSTLGENDTVRQLPEFQFSWRF